MATSHKESEQLLRRLHLVALPLRLRIVALLESAGRPLRVTEITAGCPGSQQPEISHHLKILKSAGILQSKKRSTSVYYELVDTELVELLRCLQEALR